MNWVYEWFLGRRKPPAPGHFQTYREEVAPAQADANAPPALTWPCHFCRDARPDELVGTRTRVNVLPHGVEVQENRRYCLDRPGCAALADLWAVEA